jgi:D-inositol-3-phosphate glycosyltransferase
LKILLVTPSYFPITGGSEVLTRILAAELNETGIHADVMTFNMNRKWHPKWKKETIKEGKMDVFRTPACNPLPDMLNPLPNLFRIHVLPSLTFLRNLQNYDIIHFIGEADLTFPILSSFVDRPKLLHCVGIFRFGGMYRYYTHDRPFLLRLFRRYFPNLADLYVISSHEEEELLIDLGIPEDRVLILPLGVETEIFHPSVEKKIQNMVLFVGRIDRIKGLHILLEALQYISTPIEVVIIGSRWDEAYAEEVEGMSKTINCGKKHAVKFLGSLNREDLVPWYQKASVLVCPYLFETHSNVVREALACGTPVISTGTHMSNVEPDGILLTRKDPEDLARAIEKMMQDRQLREEYGATGRRFIVTHRSWKAIVRNLVDAYKGMSKRA